MVMVLPVYELEQPGFLYNTAAVIDADGTYLGKYRKHHLPHLPGFWEKFYFRPGNGGYPVFDTAVGKIGVYICYDRHFPEGWRALGLNGAQIVFNPSATSAGLSDHLWKLEQPAAAVANEYYIGAINRVGIEEYGDDDFYGTSYFVGPEGRLVGEFFTRDSGRLEIVLNRYMPRMAGIDEDSITKALTLPAKWKIPSDYPAVKRAQNTATALSQTDSPISRVIRQMARVACGLPPTPKKKGFLF